MIDTIYWPGCLARSNLNEVPSKPSSTSSGWIRFWRKLLRKSRCITDCCRCWGRLRLRLPWTTSPWCFSIISESGYSSIVSMSMTSWGMLLSTEGSLGGGATFRLTKRMVLFSSGTSRSSVVFACFRSMRKIRPKKPFRETSRRPAFNAFRMVMDNIQFPRALALTTKKELPSGFR